MKKTTCLIGVLVIMPVFCGCNQAPAPVPVSDEQLVQNELTNDIVGYSRTISIDWDNAASIYGTSRYDVTDEFVNAVGGVERTNLVYRIWDLTTTNSDGTPGKAHFAMMDPDWRAAMVAEQREALTNSLKEIIQ